MSDEKIKELKYWINDANEIIKQDRHKHCMEYNIKYDDYYPFITGQLKAHIEILKKIIESG